MNANQEKHPMDGETYQQILTHMTNNAIQGGACTPAQIISALEVTKAAVINRLFKAQEAIANKGPIIIKPEFRPPSDLNGGGQRG